VTREISIFAPVLPSWNRSIFWKGLLLSCVSIIVLVSIINAVVDPFGLYGTGIFPQFTFNRYLNLRTLFAKYEPKPEALIIGSSRVSCIDPDVVTELTGKHCFNWGVPSAEAEIYPTILKMALDEFNAPIDLVIVGVEPEVFHPTKEIHPQAGVLESYTKYFTHESRLRSAMERARRLVTSEQLSASAVVIRRKLTGQPSGDWMIWREDGFPTGIIEERVPKRYITDREEHILAQLDIFPEAYFMLSEFDRLSPVRKAYWEEFLKICKDRNIQVYVFMPPPHPLILERLYDLGAKPIFDETSVYLEKTVTDMGGTFMDFTEVSSFGGDPDGFQDQVHILPENGELMVRELLKDYPALE